MTKRKIDEIEEILRLRSLASSKEWLCGSLDECIAELKRIHEMIFEDPTQPIINIRGTKTGV